jgi:hypothetical protein
MNLQETDISIEISREGLDSSNNLEVRKAIKVAKLIINSGRALRTDDVSPSPQTPIPIVENMNNSFVPVFKSNDDNRIVKKDWHEETITAGN